MHLLWADDLILVSSYSSSAQRQLDGLSNFSSPNQMIANEIKTKYMLFGKQTDFSLHLNGKCIERVKSFKCLGNMINSIFSTNANIFRDNAQYLCNRAKNSIFGIMQRVKRNGYVSIKCMLYLYETIVRPILRYGSDVLGLQNSSTKSVDKVLYWFLRMVLHVKASTSN